MTPSESRDVSAAIFGNGKWVQVVLALESWTGTPCSQELARDLGTTSDLITKVLRRMKAGDLVKDLPRVGSSTRGTVPWEVQRGDRWDAVVSLARLLAP